MKKIFFFLAAILFFTFNAQAQKKQRVSPMDSVETTLKKDVTLKIVYSRPSLKGRKLSDIVTFGEVWRTGANEATTFEVSKNVTVDGKNLQAGKYSLYTILGEKESVVIFNKIWHQWGTKYDSEEDALRITVKTKQLKSAVEKFTIEASKSGVVSLLWEKMDISFRVKAR